MCDVGETTKLLIMDMGKRYSKWRAAVVSVRSVYTTSTQRPTVGQQAGPFTRTPDGHCRNDRAIRGHVYGGR